MLDKVKKKKKNRNQNCLIKILYNINRVKY